MLRCSTRKGYFTLLEIMPTVSLLAAIAVIVILSLNPKKQFEEARNARRRADLLLLADAISSYAKDKGVGVLGSLPSSPNPAIEICRAEAASGCYSLEALLGVYLDAIPTDPLAPSDGQTRYFLQRASVRSITVSAPDTEPSTAPDLEVTL
jgi:type II secretory pathway pseudopilin PulG